MFCVSAFNTDYEDIFSVYLRYQRATITYF
jgi:hypothetical protein